MLFKSQVHLGLSGSSAQRMSNYEKNRQRYSNCQFIYLYLFLFFNQVHALFVHKPVRRINVMKADTASALDTIQNQQAATATETVSFRTLP